MILGAAGRELSQPLRFATENTRTGMNVMAGRRSASV